MFELFQFDTTARLLMGLATGLVFGFLLQKGSVTRFRTIVGQFLWRDHTVLKTMLTAIVVGGVGVYAMHLVMDVPLHVKSASVLGNVVGGVIFGVGMAILGYCPGTGVAALGDGSRHAIPGIFGMIAGAAVYAEVEPWITANLLSVGKLGKVTLPDVSHVSVWIYLVALAVGAAVFVKLLPSGPRATAA